MFSVTGPLLCRRSSNITTANMYGDTDKHDNHVQNKHKGITNSATYRRRSKTCQQRPLTKLKSSLSSYSNASEFPWKVMVFMTSTLLPVSTKIAPPTC